MEAVPFHKIFHIRKLGETAVFYALCVKLKLTLLSIIIRGGSGRPAISNMEQALCGNSFTLKAVKFCCRGLGIRQTLACNLDPRSSSKV